jgi:hypothetical protein
MIAIAAVMGCGGGQGKSALVQAGKMPPGGDFDGVFQSPAYGRMEFTVDGGQAIGLYEGERHYGRIEGQLNGNLMLFNWTQWKEDMQGKVRKSTGRGYFKYIIDVEGGATTTREVHRLKGEWGYGESDAGNPWGAIKLSKRAKKRLQPRDPSIETDVDDDFGTGSGFDDAADEEGETEVQMSDPDEEEEEEEEEEAGSVDDLF